jgi:hypothetical protein
MVWLRHNYLKIRFRYPRISLETIGISVDSETNEENGYQKEINRYSETTSSGTIDQAIRLNDQQVHACLLLNPRLTPIQFKAIFPNPRVALSKLFGFLPIGSLFDLTRTTLREDTYLYRVMALQASKLDEDYLLTLVGSTVNKALLHMFANIEAMPEAVQVMVALQSG